MGHGLIPWRTVSHNQRVHGFTMDLPWIYHGFTMDLPWIYHGFTMDLPWIYHGFTMKMSMKMSITHRSSWISSCFNCFRGIKSSPTPRGVRTMTAAADVRRDSSTPRCAWCAGRCGWCAGWCHGFSMDFPGKNPGISWDFMVFDAWDVGMTWELQWIHGGIWWV